MSRKKARTRPSVRISDIVTIYTNLDVHNTGSGGKALHHPLADGGHILITKRADGLRPPTDRDRKVWCGIYDKHGQCRSPAELVPVAELEGWIDLHLCLARNRGDKAQLARRVTSWGHLANARFRFGQAAAEIERCEECIALAFRPRSKAAKEIRQALEKLYADLEALQDQLPDVDE